MEDGSEMGGVSYVHVCIPLKEGITQEQTRSQHIYDSRPVDVEKAKRYRPDAPTDRQTDRQTDNAGCRVACIQVPY